jgi:hypothetical protein
MTIRASVRQRTRVNDDTDYLHSERRVSPAFTRFGHARLSPNVRGQLRAPFPTSRRGLMVMSFSDLEHFPFEERRAAEPAAPGSGSAAMPNEGTAPSSRDAKIFRDGNGVTWWVHEVAGEHLGTAGAACLLVVSASELRRVWKYPADWRSLTPEQLLQLAPSKSYGR